MKKKKGKAVCTSETTVKNRRIFPKYKKNPLFFFKYMSNIISLPTKDRSCQSMEVFWVVDL